MDAWLKAKAESLAQAAQQHVSALEQTLDPTKAQKGNGVLKELKFGQGPLGFAINGMHIVGVDTGTQAARLGIEVGDRLVMIDGRPVPDFEEDDEEGKRQAEERVKDMMAKMPLPAMLVFAPATPPPSEGEPDSSHPVDELAADGEDVDFSCLATFEADEDLEALHEQVDLEAPTGDLPTSEAAASAQLAASSRPAGSAASAASTAGAAGTASAASAATGRSGSAPSAAGGAEVAALQAELQHERAARAQLALEVRGGRQLQAKAAAALDAEKRQSAGRQKQVAELQKLLAATKAENKELLSGHVRSEAAASETLEASHKREQAVKEELDRLRQSIEAGGQTAQASAEAAGRRAAEAEGRVAELQATIARQKTEAEDLVYKRGAADLRAETSELQVDSLRRQFAGFREAHETEVELLTKDHQMRETLHKGRLDEQDRLSKEKEEEAAAEIEKFREELDVSRRAEAAQRKAADVASYQAEAAAIELAAAKREAQKAAERLPRALDGDGQPEAPGDLSAFSSCLRTPGATKEVVALYDRIDHLETRCSSLQKRLNARPIVNPGNVNQLPVDYGAAFELFVTSLAGPRVGTLAAKVYGVPDGWLRSFTQLLLRKDLWRWAFYAHVVILYTVASGFFAQAALDPGSPVDSINLQMESIRKDLQAYKHSTGK